MDDTECYGFGLLNDETHSFDYVIHLLTKLCGVTSFRHAFELAREIDQRGKAVVFSGTRDECEIMLRQVAQYGPDPLVPNSTGSIAGYIERDAKPTVFTERASGNVWRYLAFFLCTSVLIILGLWSIRADGFKKPGSRTGTAKQRAELTLPLAKPRIHPVGVEDVEGTFASCGRGGKSYIDQIVWRNAWDRPIRTVYVNIYVFNKDDVQVHEVLDYPIYSVSNSEPGVAPGETHRPAWDEGYVIPFGTSAPDAPHKATFRITRISEVGIK